METVLNFVYFFFITFAIYRIVYGVFFKSFYKIDADESKEVMDMEFTDDEIANSGKNALIYRSTHFRMLFLEKGAFLASAIGIFSPDYSMLFSIYFAICLILTTFLLFKINLYRSMEFLFDSAYYTITTVIAIVFSVTYILYLAQF